MTCLPGWMLTYFACMRISFGAVIVVIIGSIVGCGGDPKSRARPVPGSVTWKGPAAMTDAPPAVRARAAVARPVASVAPPSRASAKVSPPRPAVDWKNRQRPTAGDPELTRQGRALLAAIVKNDSTLAHGFFFPRKPFAPLKEAGNPDRYWQHIFGLYRKDLRRLRRRRQVWSGAIFESLRPGTPPVWIKPGRVHNKIGYYRTRFSRLRYRYDGKRYTLFLHTLISWQGHWYVTHLLPPPRPRNRIPTR